jgi:nitrous oxidase accessory protein
LTLRAEGIEVEGLEVQGVGSGNEFYEPDAAVWLEGCHRCVVRGLRAEGVTAGVRIENSNEVLVQGSVLSGSLEAPGILVYRSHRTHLLENRVDGFLDNLYLEYGQEARVVNNRLEGAGRYGLHLMFMYRTQVEGNQVRANRVGSAIMHGAENRVANNTFAREVGPLRYGLLLQEEWGSILTGNWFTGNTIGLLSQDSRDTRLKGNRFDANGTALLFARDTDQNTLKAQANKFMGNLYDVAVDDPAARIELSGNRYDRASPLPVPHLPSSSFAMLATRQPDLSLFALSPGILLWEAAENRVPGLRLLTLVDREAQPTEPTGFGIGLWALALGVLSLLGVLWLRR